MRFVGCAVAKVERPVSLPHLTILASTYEQARLAAQEHFGCRADDGSWRHASTTRDLEGHSGGGLVIVSPVLQPSEEFFRACGVARSLAHQRGLGVTEVTT